MARTIEMSKTHQSHNWLNKRSYFTKKKIKKNLALKIEEASENYESFTDTNTHKHIQTYASIIIKIKSL